MLKALGAISIALPLLLGIPAAADTSEAAVDGMLRVWQPISLTFQGPTATETDDK